MTKRQWLASKDPDAMLSCLESHLTFEETDGDEDPLHDPAIRKLRLFAVACCRRIEHLLTDNRSRTALDVMERYLDRRATRKQLDRATDASADVTWELPEGSSGHEAASAVYSAMDEIQDDFQDASEVAEHAVDAVVAELPEDQREKMRPCREVERAERAAQAQFLREIFGNPFHPVTRNPSWLTSDVLLLAQGIYDERAFNRMPILADALQDAGCDSEAVLSHCRDPKQVHVCGCWVLDLLLGK